MAAIGLVAIRKVPDLAEYFTHGHHESVSSAPLHLPLVVAARLILLNTDPRCTRRHLTFAQKQTAGKHQSCFYQD